MRTKRTWGNFKKAVANESKRHQFLQKSKGRFNEQFLRWCYKNKMTAIETINSMLTVT